MRLRDPIIVVGTPRSGTSMIAGLFYHHGVWVGPYREGDAKNPKGYFESTPFKVHLINQCGRIVHRGVLAPRVDAWNSIAASVLRRHGYEGGPWLVKHSAMYYPVWHEFDPIWVCCRRDPKAIEVSGRLSNFLNNPDAIRPHIEAMDALDGFDVDTKAVAHGDFGTLEPAFDAAGIEFDASVAEDFVDPDLWHH